MLVKKQESLPPQKLISFFIVNYFCKEKLFLFALQFICAQNLSAFGCA